MTHNLRSIGRKVNSLRFPLLSATDPAESITPDPRDKRPAEIERIREDDQPLPAKDESMGDEKPRTPPPAQNDQTIFN
ncbi:hypothetical protein [Alcaligenes parafaecalis]|uniref:Uncharacterized protein n=1 Tax=Alcaligenes parafaecalis TaxID=171260 RepID=A0ABT3VI60_9BURK|nr:hypothetical protein [Alcaligenes parafaecalis]MCX5463179.1 hypothetical protein [Alcaligenes parafaecalis]